jgi:superfamily II DNA/RNA helicase
MSFATGSLVKARGREWVVLPDSDDAVVVLRPLGGTEDEVTGICLALEKVEPARFSLPDPSQLGDYRSCRLLRDAVRLGFRSSAGPFRSFGRIAVEPRPYQLVPLLMALKLDPIRLLIADDVGIGKTTEAALVARELLDRGEVDRLAVLCPPHLAEQWQSELREKFHIEAELVLPSTVRRLERDCGLNQSLFEIYPHVIVSIDFIKTDRRRDDFLRTCPEMVIVDEAHTCAFGEEGRSGRHQRHELVQKLAANKGRHVVLVTATPHSGDEGAFRSLLAMLNPEFANLPNDLTGPNNEQHRRRLAAQFVQRRRSDIRHYLNADTLFPEREDKEQSYQLSKEYKQFFDRVLRYARETVTDTSGGQFRQRVRWWSALALLRALASSPAAAAATLRSRAASADAETTEEADKIGRSTVLDLDEGETEEGVDVTPGADAEEDDPKNQHRRLLEMARFADSLRGEKDWKLLKAINLVKAILKDGFRPIVFCRFIHTAEYVAEQLRNLLPKNIEVAAVTGTLPPDERESRIEQLSQAPQHLLVCTDCLSEGINLQNHFDAVMHYDLSWNPTRHEQREGRVDRYGQERKRVRVLTYYGIDNQIDGIVLDVLIRKSKAIRNSLGISVPVPVDTEQVIEAIFEGLLLREQAGAGEQLTLFNDYFKPRKERLHADWESAANNDKRSRTMFAQVAIKVDEVARELESVRSAIGSEVDVSSFTERALQAHKATVSKNGCYDLDLSETPVALREAVGNVTRARVRFSMPVKEGEIYLQRTHPFVEGLAAYVMNTALDPLTTSVARRAGVIKNRKVSRRTTLLLLRLRYHIVVIGERTERALLAEDSIVVPFAGSPQNPEWLSPEQSADYLALKPEQNVAPDIAASFIRKIVGGFGNLQPHLEEVARDRGNELLNAHRRVRAASLRRNISYRVDPSLPPDALGIYLYLPFAD